MLWEIRQGLRRGSLFVPHSLSYRDKEILFDTTGTIVRAPGCQRPLPELLDQLCANIEVGLEQLDEALWFEHLRIDGTKIHQHPLAQQETPPDLEATREELYASLPTVHLPDLIMAIDSETRFSWILLGREPANEQELLYVYAALLGHAMDLSAQRLSLMTPGLSVSGLTSAMQMLEDGPALRLADRPNGRSTRPTGRRQARSRRQTVVARKPEAPRVSWESNTDRPGDWMQPCEWPAIFRHLACRRSGGSQGVLQYRHRKTRGGGCARNLELGDIAGRPRVALRAGGRSSRAPRACAAWAPARLSSRDVVGGSGF